jgi:hypothetical protein
VSEDQAQAYVPEIGLICRVSPTESDFSGDRTDRLKFWVSGDMELADAPTEKLD